MARYLVAYKCGQPAGMVRAGTVPALSDATAQGRIEVERCLRALRDAIALCDHADTENPHGPWCNGVHEAGGCEGAASAGEILDRCRAALATYEEEVERLRAGKMTAEARCLDAESESGKLHNYEEGLHNYEEGCIVCGKHYTAGKHE